MMNSHNGLGAGSVNCVVVEGDLLDQDVEVIVNAWNRNFIPWWLLIPHGVSGAIKKRAGYEPFKELARFGPLPLGGAVKTSAGRLPHHAIIHVAGINAFWLPSERSIRDSVRNSLRIAHGDGIKSIAFPLIGSGTGRFKPDGALALMMDEIAHTDYAGEVRIVRYEDWRAAARKRHCYCDLWDSKPDAFKGKYPLGYCGTCGRCGKPGHLRHAPNGPYTDAWCDTCFKRDFYLTPTSWVALLLLVGLYYF